MAQNSIHRRTILTKEHFQSFLEQTTNRLEDHLEERFTRSDLKAEVLKEQPVDHVWYEIPVENGMTADGSDYHIYLRKGTSDHLCIILSGGGMAWNAYTASRPITAGKFVTNQAGYYYSNVRPSTQILNIGGGITNTEKDNNPFRDWSFVVISYATGDFHIGNYDYPYTDDQGNKQILHFHGHTNFTESMKLAKKYFPHPDQLLFAGDSAGGFAVSALSRELVETWYPDCQKITLLSDAAMLVYPRWKETMQEIWHASPSFYEDLQNDIITLEWYRKLIEQHPKRVQCLYCGSIHDYLLTAYYNDFEKKEFKTDTQTQQVYHKQLKEMVYALQKLDPDFGFFIHNFHMPLSTGTVHTTLRRTWFYIPTSDGHSICDWLYNCVNGDVENIGMHLLYDI